MAEQRDEFEGQGGSYRIDPKTKKRVLIERTSEEAAPQQESNQDEPTEE